MTVPSPASPPHQAGTPPFGGPMRQNEFVTMMAAIMALNALAVDSMLPAFPAIGAGLGVTNANNLQFIVTIYLFSNGVGSLLAGPIADRFGRRPVLLISILLCAFFAFVGAAAPSFELLIASRIANGLAAAALGVLSISVIRDRYTGDTMARLMSLVFIIFMIVPVIAPTLGQVILHIGTWRDIFIMLGIGGLLLFGWVALRLPETMTQDDRQKLNLATILGNWRIVATHRLGMAYSLAAGFVLGGLFGFLGSSQQIFANIYSSAEIFPFAFACVAGSLAVANYSNSRIVERFGVRRVSQTAVIAYILFALVQIGLAVIMAPPPMVLFLMVVAVNMSLVGFTGANFGSIAMEPFGHLAGAASSFQSFLRMVIASGVGAITGQRYDGTVLPLAEGFLACGLIGFALVFWGERGRMFTRPGHASKREATPLR